MNMYLHELKSLRKSVLIWVLAMIAISAFYLSLYPEIVKDAADFKSMLANYPASIRGLLGISLDNITSFLGFYSMVGTFVVLCGSIQVMNYGLSILTRETRERTADFLLVKPVSRTAIVSFKILAAITMFLATDMIYYAATSIVASIVVKANYSMKLFFMINATLLFIQLIFFSIGIVVSVIIPKLRSVLPVSLGTTFGLYFIGSIIVTDKNDWGRFITPFKYFDYTYIIKNSSYEPQYLIISAVIVIISIVATYLIYNRKDIHAAS